MVVGGHGTGRGRGSRYIDTRGNGKPEVGDGRMKMVTRRPIEYTSMFPANELPSEERENWRLKNDYYASRLDTSHIFRQPQISIPGANLASAKDERTGCIIREKRNRPMRIRQYV